MVAALLVLVGCKDAEPSKPPDDPAVTVSEVCPPDAPSAKKTGDANGDGFFDLADVAYLRDAVTSNGGPDPWCADAVDGTFLDESGLLQPDDVNALLISLYEGAFNLPNLPYIDCDGESAPAAGACADVGFSITPAEGSTARVHLTAPTLAVQGWSVSVSAGGCTITDAVTDGTAGASRYDDPPGQRDLGYAATFRPTGGATSAVLLGLVTPTTADFGTDGLDVLSLTLEKGEGCFCTLSTTAPLVGLGRPVESIVVAGGMRYEPLPVVKMLDLCGS